MLIIESCGQPVTHARCTVGPMAKILAKIGNGIMLRKLVFLINLCSSKMLGYDFADLSIILGVRVNIRFFSEKDMVIIQLI